jgi:hypothetical protein
MNPTAQRKGANVHSSIRFASVAQSDETRMTQEGQLFPPADKIQVGFVPDGSISSLAHKNIKDGASRSGSETV